MNIVPLMLVAISACQQEVLDADEIDMVLGSKSCKMMAIQCEIFLMCKHVGKFWST